MRLNENELGPKTKRYFERTSDGKLLLRKVLGRYVGAEAVEREKQGFSVRKHLRRALSADLTGRGAAVPAADKNSPKDRAGP